MGTKTLMAIVFVVFVDYAQMKTPENIKRNILSSAISTIG
jgi:hypothetical protein